MSESRMALRHTVRILFAVALATFVVHAGAAAAPPEAVRSAIFVVGPAAGDPRLQAVRSAAFACRRWLRQPGASAELRRAGSSRTVTLDKIVGKDLDSAFLAAAKDAGDRDPADLISTLDDAVHALANRHGVRVAVAILDAALLSADAEESLRQIIQFSSDNSVHIVFLDPSRASPETSGEIWKLAGASTSGAFIQESRTLASTLLLVSGVQPTAADAEPAPPAAAAPNGPSNRAAELPVHVRFIQISNRSTSHQSVLSTGIDSTSGDGSPTVEGAGGPLHGYLIVQAPMSDLRFEQDARTGAYSAHAVVTQIVRSADGRIVWHANKDVKINGPVAKLKERQGGNLYLMREVLLPGGRFTLEATVEDLLARKTGSAHAPLSTGAGVPGLMVSDAMFVKAYHSNVDRFEADRVLDYQGYSIAPLLDPVFPANTPFKVELYFVIYPDVYGVTPDITLEILQEGKVVAQAGMPFKSNLRNSAQDQKDADIRGDLQHGFNYLASMNVEKMSASGCQARLTIRQGKKVVTRLADFRVAGTMAVAQKSAEPKSSN
jgi:hypothetical protein